MSGSALDLARELHAQHVAPLPILSGTKRPAVAWKQFQHAGPTSQQLPQLFDRPGLTVGVLCGEPSDRLAVLDCDNPATLDRMISLLDDPATWIVRSLRGGHIYLRTPVPVRTTLAEGLDVKAQGSYVLAPGAMHPSGTPYQWIRQSDRILELPALDAIPGLPLQAANLRPDGMPQLAWSLLCGADRGRKNGRTPRSKYASRSEAETAAIASLTRASFSFPRILYTFRAFAYVDSHFKDLARREGEARAEGWLERVYDHVSEHLATHETEAHRHARESLEWAELANWPGLTGLSDQATFQAHCRKAMRCGQKEYGASSRELAELAGLSWCTVARANHRLEKAGLVAIVKPYTAELAPTWRLQAGGLAVSSWHTSTPSKCTEVCHDETGHDLFRNRVGRRAYGLGKAGALVWRASRDGQARTLPELVEATGRNKATVWRKLTRMEATGMVERDATDRGITWRAVPGVNLDEIAKLLGVAGAGERHRLRHRHERAEHRATLGLERVTPRRQG